METTTIEISVKNWRWLAQQKRRPGDSFNDVIDQLREQYSEQPRNVIAEPESTPEIEGKPADPPTDPNEPEPADESKQADNVELSDVPDDLDIPGSGDTYERRRRAIARLYAYLKEENTSTRADFLRLIDPADVDYASGASFWSNCIKGRDSLSVLPGVDPPGEGEHTWRYTDK